LLIPPSSNISFRVQIQKEVICDLKHESRFFSEEIFAIDLYSRERSVNRFENWIFYGPWHNGVPLRIETQIPRFFKHASELYFIALIIWGHHAERLQRVVSADC
jgi:hypothetical protein